MSLVWEKPRNKTFISFLVVKVDEREKTEGSKKTKKMRFKSKENR